MAKSYCTNPDHHDGDHDQSCMPPAEPMNGELRLLRAIFGLCGFCDRKDPHEHRYYCGTCKHLAREHSYYGATRSECHHVTGPEDDDGCDCGYFEAKALDVMNEL
jgi:hypothetical protein